MFSYLLQPEVQAARTQVYVHDMGATEWEHPSDSAFVNAKAAWYAVGHPMKGAMGATLASFKSREDAERFIVQHGGELLRYEAITLEVLNNLGGGGMDSHPMPMHGDDTMQHSS
jgi:copper chaperone NosL